MLLSIPQPEGCEETSGAFRGPRGHLPVRLACSGGTEETREGQSAPRCPPGPETEVGISCWSVDGTLVNRCISAQIFTHFTQLITALVFAVYLVIQTVAPLEMLAAFPWASPERLQLQAV